MRQIVLDTETTGMDIKLDNRIVEIGCVEIINRRLTGNNFHVYINPERDSEEGALEVHGLSSEFLNDKPLFKDIAQEFVDYVNGAELIIHNAGFDVPFLNHELQKLQGNQTVIRDICSVVDSLSIARQKHPGQKNTLDALCKRYGIDNSGRELHGALLDAELLADVFLLMTGGQRDLSWESSDANHNSYGDSHEAAKKVVREATVFKVLKANTEELDAHQTILEKLKQSNPDMEINW